MIPPRGCAYICMVHRQDAFRARQKLSTGSYKIGSKVIKVTLQPNKIPDLIFPAFSSLPPPPPLHRAPCGLGTNWIVP